MKKEFIVVALALLVAIPAAGFGASEATPPGHPAVTVDKTAGKSMPEPAAEGKNDVSGKVVETMDSDSYTYTHLEKGGNKTWVACPSIKVLVGQELSFENCIELWDFRSKTLDRTFDKIKFCNLPTKQTFGEGEGKFAGRTSTGSKALTMAKDEKIEVQKAAGDNARTVAEIYAMKDTLNNKEVVVRGKVVKVSEQIMGNNWVHIQDGSGDQKKKTHNLVVTTKDLPAVGDTVTVTGVMAKDRDFGGGYRYEVIVEQARIAK